MLSAQQASAIREFASLVTPSGTFSIIGFTGQQPSALKDLASCGYAEDCGSEHFRLTIWAYRSLTDYEALQKLDHDMEERNRAHHAEMTALYQRMIDQEREHYTQQHEDARLQLANAAQEKKQDRRHDFIVAGFSCALTLLASHLPQLGHFFQHLVDVVSALFH